MKSDTIITINSTILDLLHFTKGKKYKTIYADPPWQFQNRTGKVAPEHKRLNRYPTMKLEDIKNLPVNRIADEKCHLYLWVPNALLPDGLEVMKAWGFEYKTNLIWEKVRKDGGPDGRGVGFYFRTMKREHSRKPDEFVDLIENCSSAPYLELFARGNREKWDMWGNQANDNYEPDWDTYSNHTQKKINQ